MTTLLFKNARIFDGTNAECAEGMNVLVADGLIQEVSARPITAPRRAGDRRRRAHADAGPDRRAHARVRSDVSMQKVEAIGEPYRTAHAMRMLGHALDCGFTTVRDIGGGDYSLAKAIADGLVRAPRFFYAGKVLSMTGGHGDFRPLEQKSARPRAVLVRHRQLRSPRGRRRRRVHPGGARASCARARTASRSWARAASHRRPIRSG